MKSSIMSKFLDKWASGKFSIWKFSIVIGFFIILNPWFNLFGYNFSIESQLTNPNRTLNVYVNNGLFTFVTTLEDGTTRKSSGIIGYTNSSFYFLTLHSEYLYIADASSQALKRDLINVNNRFFDARIKRLSDHELLLTYDEEIESEGTQEQPARLYGKLTWLE